MKKNIDFEENSEKENVIDCFKEYFSLIELLLVIAVLMILLSLLLPTLNKVREKSKQINCAGNLKQIEVIVSMYLGDHNGVFPKEQMTNDDINGFWAPLLYQYMGGGSPSLFRCPSLEYNGFPNRTLRSSGLGNIFLAQIGYGWNIGTVAAGYHDGMGYDSRKDGGDPPRKMSEISRPSGTITCGDISTRDGLYSNFRCLLYFDGDITYTPRPHQGGANYAFVDGHVEWLLQKDAYNNKKHLFTVAND